MPKFIRRIMVDVAEAIAAVTLSVLMMLGVVPVLALIPVQVTEQRRR